MKRFLMLIFISLGFLQPDSRVYGQIDPNANGFYNEALRFSQRSFGGTARIIGLGGAQVSLGGDLSSALSNPAGLGFYNKSEAVFSPTIVINDSESSYFGDITTDAKNKFNFNNLGVVIAKPQLEEGLSGFRGGAFSISAHKTNDFNNRVTYESTSPGVDFFDFILPNINSGNGDVFSDLAFDAFLIDTFIDQIQGSDTTLIYGYVDSFVDSNGDLIIYPILPNLVSESIETKGSEYQINFGYGANFNDKFYIGANIGFTTLNYTNIRTYREFRDDLVLDNFTLEEYIEIEGGGINGTIGFIARPIDELTFGFSFLTPTFYSLDDSYEAILVAQFNNSYMYPPTGGFLDEQISFSDIFLSRYELRVPWRINTGVTYFFGKKGFLSGDIEIVDHSKSHLSSNDFSTSGDNNTIDDIYKSVVNLRVGGEFRHEIFRFRGGYSSIADPYQQDNGTDNSVENIHYGLGLSIPKFFIDFGFVHSFTNSEASPYTLIDGTRPIAQIHQKRFTAVITGGIKF